MILDTISNAALYASVNENIAKVLEEVQKYTSTNFPTECAVLDGDKLFLNFAEYETQSADASCMEAHRKYIDVMYMVEGSETIYVAPTEQLSHITTPYDDENDALLADMEQKATAIRLEAGSFAVLFPQDAHAPGCIADAPCKVKKIIGKVLI